MATDVEVLIDRLGNAAKYAMSQEPELVHCEIRSDPMPCLLIEARLDANRYRKLIPLEELARASCDFTEVVIDQCVRNLREAA